MSQIFGFLEHRLSENENPLIFVGDSLTIADLRARHLVNWLSSGVIDHFPADWLPKVGELYSYYYHYHC
jgi:glutathione S-transferase